MCTFQYLWKNSLLVLTVYILNSGSLCLSDSVAGGGFQTLLTLWEILFSFLSIFFTIWASTSCFLSYIFMPSDYKMQNSKGVQSSLKRSSHTCSLSEKSTAIGCLWRYNFLLEWLGYINVFSLDQN